MPHTSIVKDNSSMAIRGGYDYISELNVAILTYTWKTLSSPRN